MTERLSNKNPCNDCKIDRQIGNPNRWECECDRCSKPYEWKNDCIKKLAEYEIAEEEGRLVVLPKCNIGDTVYIPIDFQDKIHTGEIEGFEYSKMRNAWVVKIRTDDGKTCYEAFDDFGKTFFLEEEDAAKALKEMENLNISKNITIHLTEDDVKEIIAEYIKKQKGYSVTADNMTFRVEKEYMGYGLGEYDVTVFKGCDVDVKEEI